jgi:two-component system chemotaxis sensor kinase CheA
LTTFRPRGVPGVTTLSNGQIVLILEMKELLSDLSANNDREARSAPTRALEFSA